MQKPAQAVGLIRLLQFTVYRSMSIPRCDTPTFWSEPQPRTRLGKDMRCKPLYA